MGSASNGSTVGIREMLEQETMRSPTQTHLSLLRTSLRCQLTLQAVQTEASWHIWKIVNISSYNILIIKHAVEPVLWSNGLSERPSATRCGL